MKKLAFTVAAVAAISSAPAAYAADLRMGPTNARRIQASLRRIALALGIPAARLPPP